MIDDSSAWKELEQHAKKIQTESISHLCDSDKHRFEHFSCDAPYWKLDYTRQLATTETIDLLCKLAEEAHLSEQRDALFHGKKINNTEKHAVLHTALRSPEHDHPEIQKALEQIEHFCNLIHNHHWQTIIGEPITDVIVLGIGGSRLGPELVINALKHYARHDLRFHFVSNIAPSDFSMKLKNINPSSMLFIIASKGFSTPETMTNALMAKEWLDQMLGTDESINHHFVAVTAEPKKAMAFGISKKNIFPFWDWVGGRFSLWSAIGLPIALSLGFNKFKQLLSGAYEMDQHFLQAPLKKNMPVLLALLSIWNHNFRKIPTHAIIPYSYYLEKLPTFLQQIEMESNGKRVDKHGKPVSYQTSPVVWGGAGTDSQHSFHQWLHQGTSQASVDFIAFRKSLNPTKNQQAMLFANCIAQAEVFARGQIDENSPHKTMLGNRCSNILLCDSLTPQSLGALIALYEHKVFVEGVIWDINSFDQFGVELGKQIAEKLMSELTGEKKSNIGAIEWFKES